MDICVGITRFESMGMSRPKIRPKNGFSVMSHS